MSKRLIVHSNDKKGDGKILVFKGDSLAKLKKEAGKKLGLNVKRIFLQNGIEVKKIRTYIDT